MKDGQRHAARLLTNWRTPHPSATNGAVAPRAISQRPSRPGSPRTRHLGRAALLVAVTVWLALIVGAVAQAHGVAQAGGIVADGAKATATDTPSTTPTDTPTETATPKGTASATPAGTGTPSDTPTDTPTVYVNSGPAAPQPTKLVLSQPTVGSGGGGLGGGAAGLGDSSMFIAVILGCVTSVLGIIIGGVALLALIRTGYGPFLRALVLGKRARPATAKAGKGANGRADGAGDLGRRVGDGTLNYQETGDLGGGLWRDADLRQSGRQPRAPRDSRDLRRGQDDDMDYPPRRAADPRDNGGNRAVRQPPRSDPRSRAGASRPPTRPGARSRDGW